jgi:ribosomal-protein-alanine N-acetyltransferase
MIRTITDLDRPYLYSIIKKAFKTTYISDNVFANWYVYTIDDKIVGFILYDAIYEQAEIEYIYVDKKYRNNKIATQLVDKMIENLNKKEINSITLEVNSNNVGAIEFYKMNKFKQVAVRKNYYGKDDAILMMRSW